MKKPITAEEQLANAYTHCKSLIETYKAILSEPILDIVTRERAKAKLDAYNVILEYLRPVNIHKQNDPKEEE